MTASEFIQLALNEDVQSGDYSTLAAIDAGTPGKAILKVKEDGILAGMKWAELVFKHVDPNAEITIFLQDGDTIKYGDIAFEVKTDVHTILKCERLALNIMQRMSGIATLTKQYVTALGDTNTRILDTRKTTPLFRMQEKEAVKIGGGTNHRFGLYDMVMLKDNHIDFCGGIEKAILKTQDYLKQNNLPIQIEVETRTVEDVKKVVKVGGIHRIMFDNFEPEMIVEALQIVNGAFETEASGGINMDNIMAYGKTGVDFISIGALTHHAVSLDLSLKAEI